MWTGTWGKKTLLLRILYLRRWPRYSTTDVWCDTTSQRCESDGGTMLCIALSTFVHQTIRQSRLMVELPLAWPIRRVAVRQIISSFCAQLSLAGFGGSYTGLSMVAFGKAMFTTRCFLPCIDLSATFVFTTWSMVKSVSSSSRELSFLSVLESCKVASLPRSSIPARWMKSVQKYNKRTIQREKPPR